LTWPIPTDILAKARRPILFKAPRGTQDILPEDQDYWSFVRSKAADICRLYQYRRIDTPILEQTDLFLRSVGDTTDIVEKQMYTFQDRGGDQITLRPEGTAPVCRAYIEHGMQDWPQPVRLYYVGPIFRYERPQKGRLRQHHQFGVEAIGDPSAEFDLQVITLARRFYDSLGLKELTLQLNSIGCRVCRPAYIREVEKYYTNRIDVLCADCKSRLSRSPLRLLDCKDPSCQAAINEAPRILGHLCQDCAKHLEFLKDGLDKQRIVFQMNPYLVRGLDYYTRTVFEFQPSDVGGQSAIGGGGRYDDLIEQLGGRPTPGVGFATGLERVILNMKKQGVPTAIDTALKVWIASADDEGRRMAPIEAKRLHDEDISATYASGDLSLKSQLGRAHSSGANYVIIIGASEVASGTRTIKNMDSGVQVQMVEASTVDFLKGELKRSQEGGEVSRGGPP
jgi:histidyl-tRNA synthetase